jgi:signal transduction histidine kinase
MLSRSRRPLALYLVAGGALLLLPLMALLQYRWIGQVSDAERERRERTLKAATAQVAQDLDLELFRAFVGLQVDGESLKTDDWTVYADRAQAWRAATALPTLVRDVLLIDRQGTALRLRKWDQAARTFVAAEWPADLSVQRRKLEEELAAWNSKTAHEPLRIADLLSDTDDALVMPIAPQPRQLRDHVTLFEPMFGYTIIRLDTGIIRDEFLPLLVEKHFRTGSDDEYRVAVVSRRDASQVIYRSNVDDVPDLLARHDAMAPLFGLRPDQFQLMRQADRSIRGAGPQSGERPRSLFFSVMTRRPPPESGQGGGAPEAARSFENLQRWKLVARHRAGSLEASVSAARTRNVALSSGILLLMAATVVVLARTARRSERLARQQIEFVAAVSHELRTPVSVIGSAAENLADGLVQDPNRVRQYGARIQSESRRLAETVERVLLFAGIEAGRGVGHRAPVAVSSLVNDALAASQSAIADASVKVEVEVPDGIPPVMADAGALRSSVSNLIANAIKYGGGLVRVAASSGTGKQGVEVRIAVSDQGLGISSVDLPHIFEPFYRGAEAQSRQIQGNGLGLSIVKGIVEAHGGRVTVQSAPGSGSTFVVHLPAWKGDESPVAPHAHHAPARS